jgi:hypothetical protein
MATLPRIRFEVDENGEEQLVLPEDHRLPGWTVDALLKEGKVDEARNELERLILEGANSGPGIEATPAFWDELKAEVKDQARRRK